MPTLNARRVNRKCFEFLTAISGGAALDFCGRLAGPWVDELRSCWRHARELSPGARAVVDLNEVTFIDGTGEELLAEMHSHETEFIATGVANRHVVAQLKR